MNDLLEYARRTGTRETSGRPQPHKRPAAPPSQNRPVVRRSVSTFNIIIVMVAIGAAIVFTVNNIITVNTLARDINHLQIRYDSVMNVNAVLRAEVDKKSGLERIGAAATGELRLQHAKDQPLWIEVDPALVRRLKGE